MDKTIYKHCFIFTVDDAFRVFQDGAIVFDSEAIRFVGTTEDYSNSPFATDESGANVIDGQNKLAVLPGLIDAHCHSSLLKGFTENKQLTEWLGDYQREHQVLTPEDAYWSGMINYLEAVKGGTTCVMDMYRYGEKLADAAKEVGLRLHVAPYAADTPDKPFFETLESTEQLINSHHNDRGGLTKIWVAMEHLFYCSKEMYARGAAMAKSYGLRMHTHTSEQQEEVKAVVETFGDRPVKLFKSYGIMKPETVLAHCVWLDEEEVSIVKAEGVGIAHCPISNAKLAGGIAPAEHYRQLGIAMGLGTDGAICNNSLSLFECMKYASLFQKAKNLDGQALNAEESLKLATIGGARILGIDRAVGSLEVGKHADLIVMDLWQSHLVPIASDNGNSPVLWNIVYAGRASDVTDVWVRGNPIVKDRKSTRVDEGQLLEGAHQQTRELLKRRATVAEKTMLG